MNTTRTQLKEMIRQRYNRPSILMWGLQNEVSTSSYDAQMSKMIPALHAFAKTEDPSRLTTQAQAGSTTRPNWTTDLFAENYYASWYQSGSFGSYMDGFKSKHLVNGVYHPVGMSEYGAGGNPSQHEIYTGTPNIAVTTTGPFHSEEYQNVVHQQAIKDILTRPWIWGTFVWNMFDFASDSRNEGSQPGINDKGLVTHDRQTKKDSFYAYKVNWSSEPTVYIASRRFTERNTNTTPVTVYTNGASVELFVNGVSQGAKTKTTANCGILEWTNVPLTNKGAANSETAKNTVVAKSTINGVEYTDTVKWSRIISVSTDLTSSTAMIDNVNKVIYFNTTITVETLATRITGTEGATFTLVAADGITPVTSENVEAGMKLLVTAEDGVTHATYTFANAAHIALKKTATADATENTTNTADKAIDGNNTTRWAAPTNATASAPHWLEVDLGKEYFISQVNVLWYDSETNHRAYKYQVQAKKAKTEASYTTLDDKTNNTTLGLTTSTIANKLERYIKINITGSAQNAAYNYPSIYELMVYGWTIESVVYTIDFVNKTITVPSTGENIEHTTFLNNITFEGQETHSISSAAYYIVDGDKLVVKDTNGVETEFIVTLKLKTDIKNVEANDPVVAVQYYNLIGQPVGVDLSVSPKSNSTGAYIVKKTHLSGKKTVNKFLKGKE